MAIDTLLGVALAAVLLLTGRATAQQSAEWRSDFSRRTVPLDEIVSGGPPRDGIPAIDRPRFVSARYADDWLSHKEPVVLVTMGNEAKAYPLQLLIWHEIVNDGVSGRAVAVTYCPLCNTALAFDRRLDGRLLEFGTTGRLRHSGLVMYDRQTESWWQQATGEAIAGELAQQDAAYSLRALRERKAVNDVVGRVPRPGRARRRDPEERLIYPDIHRSPAISPTSALFMDGRQCVGR